MLVNLRYVQVCTKNIASKSSSLSRMTHPLRVVNNVDWGDKEESNSKPFWKHVIQIIIDAFLRI